MQAQGGQRLPDGSGAVQLLCLPLFCSKTDKQTIRLGGLAPVDRAVLQDFLASLHLSPEQLGAINDPSALYLAARSPTQARPLLPRLLSHWQGRELASR